MDSSKEGKLTILHFNDVYEIEEDVNKHIGGIARFKTALDQYKNEDPLIVFSGDLFSPAILTPTTNGEQMVYPMNQFGTTVACIGNHDLDIEPDILEKWIKQSTYPWVLSNVIEKATNTFICGSLEYYIVERNGFRVGFFGLAEYDWILTLNTLTPDDVYYEDFKECAERMYDKLKEKECDLVIAITHMRNHNDLKLAFEFRDLDMILGGHDHVHLIKNVEGTYVIKSGCEFREFNKITLQRLTPENRKEMEEKYPENIYKNNYIIDIETIQVDGKFEKDPDMDKHVKKYNDILNESHKRVLGIADTELETAFDLIRASEQNLPNFLADVMKCSSGSDVAILCSGAVRSDKLFEKGNITLGDLKSMIPFVDLVFKLEVTGEQLWKALENGVSQYPAREGRFPAVSGMKFSFDPSKKPMERILEVTLDGKGPLQLGETYTLATIHFVALGKDGYDHMKECKRLTDFNTSPDLSQVVTKFFDLVSLPECFLHSSNPDIGIKLLEEFVLKNAKPQLIKRKSSIEKNRSFFHQMKPLIKDINYGDEVPKIIISPKIEGRITLVSNDNTQSNIDEL